MPLVLCDCCNLLKYITNGNKGLFVMGLIPRGNDMFVLLLSCMQIPNVTLIGACTHLSAGKMNQSLLMAEQSSQSTLPFSANLVL